jgi:hypothetical protein
MLNAEGHFGFWIEEDGCDQADYDRSEQEAAEKRRAKKERLTEVVLCLVKCFFIKVIHKVLRRVH